MDDQELVSYLIRCIDEDNHAYAYVAHQFGGEALLDSHLPMLDLIESLAQEWQAMDPADGRYAGLTHALRVIAKAYYHSG
ncbi:hypothetical protein FHR83_009304 [Actinoplanes campanulatus]|uniref:Uncharacterized protein n=1 Tax=Actinoplanes campanulatus TaxID=113559 RepID=A0A7W5FKG8_9ACTN|nr:hypothetical protein [Actinoplanes campanulatus]MBB3101575.1 hypothetical protein [Actinoplanes campanulatus]GGN51561.1 hypothetical protein GCM10010109_91770 [Actinoplanes campanulatus]GID42645.1 hypothetical protein Aca09nite_91510 [Actinoplanes campanulatus]